MDDLWTIVLAAGEGRRLMSLTERLYGFALPKQFAVLDGKRSLLQRTVERLIPITTPERTIVVLPRRYDALGREQLAGWPGIHVVTQPLNRGTGPGILLPLAYLLERAPEAVVCISPSDHHFRDDEAPRRAIRRAAAAVDAFSMIVVGAEATSPETEYGWIERGSRCRGCATVRGFVEKPESAVAERLHRERALWNTFLMIARARVLWDRAARRMPVHATAIRACRPIGAGAASDLHAEYSRLSSCDFSRLVLQRERDLGTVELSACGWSDLGSPARVHAALGDGPALQHAVVA